jgi:hypothetical protein
MRSRAGAQVGIDALLKADPAMPHRLPTGSPSAFGVGSTTEFGSRFMGPTQPGSALRRARALAGNPQHPPPARPEHLGAWAPSVAFSRRGLIQRLAQLQQAREEGQHLVGKEILVLCPGKTRATRGQPGWPDEQRNGLLSPGPRARHEPGRDLEQRFSPDFRLAA